MRLTPVSLAGRMLVRLLCASAVRIALAASFTVPQAAAAPPAPAAQAAPAGQDGGATAPCGIGPGWG